jgi:hypothetical protein
MGGLRYRGRDWFCGQPPAQIPPCRFPAGGSCRRSDAIGIVWRLQPIDPHSWARRFSDTLCPAQCRARVSRLTFPSIGRLPSTLSATHLSSVSRYARWRHYEPRLGACANRTRTSGDHIGGGCSPIGSRRYRDHSAFVVHRTHRDLRPGPMPYYRFRSS